MAGQQQGLVHIPAILVVPLQWLPPAFNAIALLSLASHMLLSGHRLSLSCLADGWTTSGIGAYPGSSGGATGFPPTTFPCSSPKMGDEMGKPGAPSERMDRWVVGQDEADAHAQAEAKFPGQQFTLQQVG